MGARLQKLAGHEASGIPESRAGRAASVAEAAALLRWLAEEVGQLPSAQRGEALRIPATLAQKVCCPTRTLNTRRHPLDALPMLKAQKCSKLLVINRYTRLFFPCDPKPYSRAAVVGFQLADQRLH